MKEHREKVRKEQEAKKPPARIEWNSESRKKEFKRLAKKKYWKKYRREKREHKRRRRREYRRRKYLRSKYGADIEFTPGSFGKNVSTFSKK